MKQCPICSKRFPDEAAHCDVDGHELPKNASSLADSHLEIRTLGELVRLKSPLEIIPAVNLIIAISRSLEELPGKTAGYLNPNNLPLKNGSELDAESFKAEMQALRSSDNQSLDEAAPYLSPE